MTWYEVLHEWMNSFGLPAYPKAGVPDELEFPWITYERKVGSSVEITVHLYFYTDSEKVPNAKAEEICSAMRNGGVQLRYDEGIMWLKTSSPEWFAVEGDSELQSSNYDVKHRVINMTVDFMTLRG